MTIARVTGRWLSAVARKLGPYRLLRLCQEAARCDPEGFKANVQFVLRENLPTAWLDPDFSRFYADAVSPVNCASLPIDVNAPDVIQLLDEIPSEATPGERRFLYDFFKTVWPGRNHVFEIGPFLGGTTRAIAMGMLANPRRQTQCKLYTCDRFREYYSPAALQKVLAPLVQRGIVSPGDLEEIRQDASFRAVFNVLHRAQNYFPMLEIMDKGVPDLVEESSGNHMHLPAGQEFDVFFVDGCKSWYGTKYFMLEACRNAMPGCYFIFQDYGHWTCFWISAFLSILGDYFDLVAFVDDTYAFQLQKRLCGDVIQERFPDSATAVSRSDYERMYQALTDAARRRGDRRSGVTHQIHLAAALAMLGHDGDAEQLLTKLIQCPYSVGYEKRIQRARAWLTYYPAIENGQKIQKVIKLEKFEPRITRVVASK